LKDTKSKPTSNKFKSLKKYKLLQQYKKLHKSIPEDHYLVVEIVMPGCTQHKHIKGTKGGEQIKIHSDLQKVDQIKEYLLKITNASTGPFQQMFTKAIAPIVKMAQSLINIPEEAFLGGFCDIAPHKIACYRKENTVINKKMSFSNSQKKMRPSESLNG
jgi:hypothetical protein